MNCKFSTTEKYCNNSFTVIFTMKLSMVSFAMNEIAASIALIMTIFRAKKQSIRMQFEVSITFRP